MNYIVRFYGKMLSTKVYLVGTVTCELELCV